MIPKKLDRRVQRTRQSLQEALLTLVQDKGYAAVTIQDITDLANLGRATFYLHYRNKEELLADSLRSIYGELLHYSRSYSFTASKRLQSGLDTFRHVQTHHRLYRILFSDGNMDFLIREIRKDLVAIAQIRLEASVAQGAKVSLPIDILAYQVASSQIALIRWWLENDMPYPPEYMAEVYHALTTSSVKAAVKPSRRPTSEQ